MKKKIITLLGAITAAKMANLPRVEVPVATLEELIEVWYKYNDLCDD